MQQQQIVTYEEENAFDARCMDPRSGGNFCSGAVFGSGGRFAACGPDGDRR